MTKGRTSRAAKAFAVVAMVGVGACGTDSGSSNVAATAPRPAKPDGDSISFSLLNPPQDGHKVRFTLAGTDYFAVEAIIPLMNAEFQRQGGEAQPLADRVGGKVKVVLATFRQGGTIFTSADPEATQLVQRALQEYALAVARGRVEALRASRLFDDVTVETADVSDVALGGYDVVLWQPATNPWTWQFRIPEKKDALTLVSPLKATVAQFPEVLRDNIRKAERPPSG
jgi:hypothetical protein